MARANKAKAKGVGGKGRGRKSKAENMTGAKEGAAEMRKGELDLQPMQINDNDFEMHYRSAKSAKEKVETATSLYRNAIKGAKQVSDELADAVKRALKFDGMDREAIKRQLEIDGYVLKKQGCSVQLTIHDSILGDANTAAEKQGYADGRAGRALNNPFPENSDLARLYEAAWLKAQTEMVPGGDGIGHNSENAGPDDEHEDGDDERITPPVEHDGDEPAPMKEAAFA